MPGQGYHLGLAKMVADQQGRGFSKQMIVGVLLVDALNLKTGGRRCSHFTGGAGSVVPRYNQLRQVFTAQSWDSGFKKSYLVDPKIDVRLFEAASIHISEGDYKDGIRIHLLADKYYDRLIQQVLFNITRQKDGIVVHNATGRKMDEAQFRKEIYAVYPLLDQLAMQMAGITAEDIERIKELISSVLTDEMSEFVLKYLHFNANLEWKDTEFFQLADITELIETTVLKTVEYLSRK